MSHITGTRPPKADMRNWRKKLQEKKIKFNDEVKTKYLMFLLESGEKHNSAEKAVISYTAVQNHRENDPEFAIAEEAVLALRAENIVRRIEKEAMDGFDDDTITKDGQVQKRKRFETPLRSMLLKKYDSAGHRDKQDINMQHSGAGGVLVVPAKIDPTDFVKESLALRDKMLEDAKKDD